MYERNITTAPVEYVACCTSTYTNATETHTHTHHKDTYAFDTSKVRRYTLTTWYKTFDTHRGERRQTQLLTSLRSTLGRLLEYRCVGRV